MIHEMKLNDNPFNLIKSKHKTIELRLYDEKRRKIEVGHAITFNNNKTNDKLNVLVTNLYIYKNFEELYKNHNKINLGYLEEEIANPCDMELYYSKEEQEKYSVVGIEVKVMDHFEFLQYQYRINKKRRIENTIKILEDVADEMMKGKEKEEFLNNLK